VVSELPPASDTYQSFPEAEPGITHPGPALPLDVAPPAGLAVPPTAPAGEPDDDAPRRRVQQRTVRLLTAAQVLGGVGVGTAASAGPLLVDSITADTANAGIGRAATTLGTAVIAVPLAGAAARYGRRTSLSAGWFLAATGAVLIGAAATRDVVLMLLGMLLFGSGNAASLQSRHAAADHATAATRARHIAVVTWGTTVGAVVGPNVASPGRHVGHGLALPPLAGGFVIATGPLLAAAAICCLLPVGRPGGPGALPGRPRGRRRGGLRWEAWSVLAHHPAARLAFVTIVTGHTGMLAVMTMTPLTMHHAGHSLTVVGITISIHILGMYAFSPLVGWCVDRTGARAVIVAAQAVFLLAAALSGTAGDSVLLMSCGMLALGLGWSLALIAGSALLAASVADLELRGVVQGLSDMTMNVGGALAAVFSGMLLTVAGFAGLNVAAMLPVLVVSWLLLTGRRAASAYHPVGLHRCGSTGGGGRWSDRPSAAGAGSSAGPATPTRKAPWCPWNRSSTRPTGRPRTTPRSRS
jgi:MFS family permease